MDKLLSKDEAAAALCVSKRTIDRLRDLPRVKLGSRRVAFRPSDIAAWAASRLSTPADAERTAAPADAA